MQIVGKAICRCKRPVHVTAESNNGGELRVTCKCGERWLFWWSRPHMENGKFGTTSRLKPIRQSGEDLQSLEHMQWWPE